jgi:threonine/homoserine/homoserine lactone efflux protein
MIGLAPLIFQGMGYGFLAGITMGPFLGYVINIVLTRGWRRSLPLISVPVLVDTPIIIIFLNLLNELPEYVLDIMSISGGTFVLWLGWNTWRENRRMQPDMLNTSKNTLPKRHSVSLRGIYIRGLLVNALNPAPYLFWSTVSGPILLDGIRDGGTSFALAFLFAYYAVFLTLIFVLMIVVERIGELNEQVNRYLLPVTIILMILLGLGLIGTGVIDLVSYFNQEAEVLQRMHHVMVHPLVNILPVKTI